MDCSHRWRKEDVILRLKKIGIVWIDYQDYCIDRPGKIALEQHVHAMRIGERLCETKSFRMLVTVIAPKAILQTCIYRMVTTDIARPVELLRCIPAIFSGFVPPMIDIWIPNTIITRSLLQEYPNVTNRSPRLWTVLEYLFGAVGRAVGKCQKLLACAWVRLYRRRAIACKENDTLQTAFSLSSNDYEVAYFPHQGVSYGNLFWKDQFYSLDQKSPFFYEKIIHFDLHGNRETLSSSWDYYRKNNIRNEDWRALPHDKKTAARAILRLLGKAAGNGFRGMDVDLLLKYAWVVWSVQTHLSRLRNLPNLKVVLIGYDILFPQTLAAACKLADIQTVAVHERMLASWWSPPLLIDHYFVIGPESRRHLQATALAPMNFYELGPVRLKDHAKAVIPDIALTIREKYSWIVLALDFHSEPDWFENGRRIANNWRSNMVFYDHLLQLCRDFPNAFFLLKGKDTNFATIPFFQERVRQFRAQPNLLILEDLELWTPFASVAAADIALARQTSLADEMLALGKPVIFDDYDGYPSAIYDYGPEVTAYSYADIKGKLTRFFAGPEGYNANLDALRKKLYTVQNKPVEQVLQGELMSIWNYIGDKTLEVQNL